MATPDDQAETERSVKEAGRRIVARIADVRERHELREAVDAAPIELGRIDIVVANAGILPMAMGTPDPMQFVDASDVDLVGVMNTFAVTIPHLRNGASIMVTGSTAGMIRVNAMHPTNCNTQPLQNDGMYSMFRPDLTNAGQQATRADAEPLFTLFQAMPIPYVEPEDIANLGVFLASDDSRYITGSTFAWTRDHF